jgi:transposase
LSRSTVYGWRKKYEEGGWDALRAKPLPGPASALTPELRAKLAAMLKRGPRSFGFRPALWTRGLVRQLVQNEFGIELSEVRIGQILREMNFSPQRPVHKAVQQDPEAVRKWREEEYPKIRDEAEKAGATVYFEDEAGVRSDHHAGTTWAPVGQTPVVESTGERKSVGMVSAISADGGLHFDVFEGRMNSARFIEFCERLMADDGGNVFLVMDNAPYHVAKAVKKFAESTGGRLRLFFLPTYSPELNPDELVWKNVKHDQIGKSGLLRGKDMFDAAWKALDNLKKAPEKVKGFFGKPDLAYIF